MTHDAIRYADWQTASADAIDIAPPSLHVRHPLADLDAIVGPLLPRELHIVSARTGSGKTLLVTNWLYSLITAPQPVGVALFPLETRGAGVVQRLACHHLGVNPAHILVGDFGALRGGREEFDAAVEEIARLAMAPGRGPKGFEHYPRLQLFDRPQLTVAQLRAAIEGAVQRGARVAIIDHLLRLDLGDGSFAEVSAAIRAIKIMADEFGIAIVVTSQQNRASAGGDKLAWYAAPDLAALKGSGAIEEEADCVVFLHRVLRDDLTSKELAEVRAGRLPLQEALAPHLMGAAVGKHRRDGSLVGAACRLWVEHGRVSDLPADVRREWQAAQQAIRTNRDIK